MELRPGYQQTEVGVIPIEWRILPITEVTSAIFLGLTSTVDYVNSEGMPLIRATDIANGHLSFEQARTISLQQHRELTKYRRAKRGDVLVSKSGSLGVCAIVNVDTEFSIYESIIVLQSNSLLDSLFLLSLLRYEATQNRMIGERVGSSVGHLNLEMFRRLVIPIPPISEQRAIAAALSDADALIESLEQLIAKKRQVKQGAMQELLTGKKRLPGFSGEWEVKRLGEIAELKNGYAFKSSTYTSIGRFNVVTIANVQDGYMDVAECNKIDSLPRDIQPHHKLEIGDVLISMTGNVGRVCRVTATGCLLNQRVGKIVPSRVDGTFLFLLLRQRRFLTAMAGKAKGGAQGNLSVADISEFEFSFPRANTEQEAIAAILSDMDEEIAVLEDKLAKARQIKQGMMQELLTGRIRLV